MMFEASARCMCSTQRCGMLGCGKLRPVDGLESLPTMKIKHDLCWMDVKDEAAECATADIVDCNDNDEAAECVTSDIVD